MRDGILRLRSGQAQAVPYGAMVFFSCRDNPLWLSVGEATWFLLGLS